MSHDKGKDEIARIRGFIEIDKSSLPTDGGPEFNRLIFSKSPYLLQHADNPVDWYPWSEEAFAKAQKENKPVLVSIGYSTCHWCHVMEEESFNDTEAAAAINKYMVPIKVDREERPDIDSQYMKVAQMMTGSGGWPLNIIMTPGKKPFYAATYIPKNPRGGMPGIIQLLERISEIWTSSRDKIEENCDKIMDALRTAPPPPSTAPVDPNLIVRCRADIEGMFDPVFGGFGGAPKFPMPLYISFLLGTGTGMATGSNAGAVADKTLRMMRAGGIFDQVGFGFHRYAVDREWLVPHFEKMLYDQALIAMAYLDGFLVSGDKSFKNVVSEIFDFVLREMRAPDGGFCSGLDADSEGEEGTFYLWTPSEVAEVLGKEKAEIYCKVFDITERGNFEGRNIPHLKQPMEKHSAELRIQIDELSSLLEEARLALLERRNTRIRPFRDEKVLTSWNGLMIAALARGGAIFGEKRLTAAAQEAATFVWQNLRDSSGRLLRTYHLGGAAVPAFLEDYAFMTWGLIELHEATGDSTHLDEALFLAEEMVRLFEDEITGGFFDTGVDAEQVLTRTRSSHDDVIPSGNSIAALNLLRLGELTSNEALLRRGRGIFQAFSSDMERLPSAYPQMLLALDRSLHPHVEITLAGNKAIPEWSAMLRAIKRKNLPNLSLKFAREGEEEQGKTVAYVCAGGACRPPASSLEELERVLGQLA